MQLQYPLSKNVQDFIENGKLTEITIGCSESQVIKVEKNDNTYFLKIANKGLLSDEYKALLWLDGKLKVPKVILFDSTKEIEYLITESLKGEMICSNNLLNDKNKILEVMKEAFQNLYQIDISECPINVSLDYKLNLVTNNVKNNLINYYQISDKTKEKFSSLEEILTYLKENKPIEELCFSHGDTSLPNIFAKNWKFSGFIDVGYSGIADKWFDLAISEKSITRNLGEEYIDEFYKKLKMTRDKKKIDYYHLLMELYL